MIRKIVQAALATVPLFFLVGLTAALSQDPRTGVDQLPKKQVVEPSPEEQRKLIKEAERFAAAEFPVDSPGYLRSLEQNLFRLRLSRFNAPPHQREGNARRTWRRPGVFGPEAASARARRRIWPVCSTTRPI